MHRHHVSPVVTFLVIGLASTILAAEREPPPAAFGKDAPWRFVAWQGNESLVTASGKQAIVWDVAKGNQRNQYRLGTTPEHVLAESPVSPDGKRLVINEAKPKTGIGLIVSLGDGPELVLTAPAKGGPFQFVSWSPDGGRLLFIDSSHVLHLWDTGTGKYAGKVGGPMDDPATGFLTFGPPSIYRIYRKMLSQGGKAKPNNKVDAGFEWLELGSTGGGVGTYSDEAWRQPIWSPDGSALLTMSLMKSPSPTPNIVLWDGRTGAALSSLAVPNRLYHQWAFSPDGRQLAMLSADFDKGRKQLRDTPWDEALDDEETAKLPPDAVALRLLHPGTGATLHRLAGNFTSYRFVWSPDSKRVIATGKNLDKSSEIHDIACWDVATGRLLWSEVWESEKWGDPGPPVISPDGKYVVLTAERNIPPEFREKEVWLHVYDADTRKPIVEKKVDKFFFRMGPPGPVWSPAGGLVLVGTMVVDATTGKVLCDVIPKREGGRIPNFRAIWQPAGKLLAVWQEEGPLRVITTDTGKEVSQLPEVKK